MLTQYVLTIINGDHIYANLIHVIFINRITNLENYIVINYKHRKLQRIISQIEHYGIINVIVKLKKIGDFVMWFPKGCKIHLRGGYSWLGFQKMEKGF
jgi:predicted DNA repair protein MutK